MNRLPSCKVSGLVLLAVVAFIAALVLMQPDRANGAVYPLEQADHQVDHLRVTYVEFTYRDALLYVEFNNGETGAYTPCWHRGQVKGNCYWVPAARVNASGRAWVVRHGQRKYIAQHLLVEAGLSL